MTHPLRLLLSVTALCCFVATARADVPPPETQPCTGKQVGDACTYNGAGVCQTATCSRLDYAHWDRDASSSPPSMSYECVKCVPGTPIAPNTGSNTNTNTGSNTKTNTGSDTNTNTGSDTSTTFATDTNTNTATDTGKDTTGGDDGCSIARTSTGKRIAPWLLAGAFSLLFLFGRRRRR